MFFNKLLDMIYPSFCFHCKEAVEKGAPLCSYCLQCLEFMPKIKFFKKGILFQGKGPAISLLRAYERGDLFLAKTLAAFFVQQIILFQWPLPEVIYSGNSSVDEVAYELSQFLNCCCIKKSSGCAQDQLGLLIILRKEDEVEARKRYLSMCSTPYLLSFC